MERFDSVKIMKREQQIHLHSQRRSKRREKIAAKRIDISQDLDTMTFPKSENERDFLDEALGENFIFSDLNEKERHRLIDAMQKQVAPKGTVIIKQGDVGDYFYVIEEGVVNFFIEGIKESVGNCSNGESFGELALLYDAPRAATCVAERDTVLWKVDQNTFRVLLARQALSREETIIGWLKKVPLFGNNLTECQLRKFCETLTPVKFSAGERIVNKGDTGDIFYIISEGKVKVHEIGLGDSQGVTQTYSQGDWFGERALLTGEPRAANVTAITDVMTEATDRQTFERALGPFQDLLDKEMKKRFLKGVPIFDTKRIRDSELDSLVKLLKEITYSDGTKLAEEGKPHPQSLWIVRSGEILVYDNKGRVFHLHSGDYYGDNSIREEPGKASQQNVECKVNTTCWVITRSEIESVIGDMKKSAMFPAFLKSETKEKITMAEVQKHRILGSGMFAVKMEVGAALLSLLVILSMPYLWLCIPHRRFWKGVVGDL
jgi:cAMP-dependent protein kinase regulator